MSYPFRGDRLRKGVAAAAVIVAMLALGLGASAGASTHASTAKSLPCEQGGGGCSNIGYTKAWLNGHTVKLEYSHSFQCDNPPSSGATSSCELGAKHTTRPTSGAVVSPIRVVVPLGFTPQASTLQCPVAGSCIDHPSTIDLSRVFGSGTENAPLPPHSHVLVDAEVHQSTWWPVRVIGVNSQHAWDKLVSGRSEFAVRACQASTHCTADIPTNLYLFFQVLPGSAVIH
ncbi:MAG: hypothetical protein ABI939_12095 [Anaerolineaceae bacterium]